MKGSMTSDDAKTVSKMGTAFIMEYNVNDRTYSITVNDKNTARKDTLESFLASKGFS